MGKGEEREGERGRRAFVAVGDRGVGGGEESHDEEHGEGGGCGEERAGAGRGGGFSRRGLRHCAGGRGGVGGVSAERAMLLPRKRDEGRFVIKK